MKPTSIDCEIERVISCLSSLLPESTDYKMAADNLKTLCEARNKKPYYNIELESVLAVVGTVVEILMILNFERFNILTSKAFNRVGRT